MMRAEADQLIDEFLKHLKAERHSSFLTIRNYRHYLGRFSDWLKKNFPRLKISSLDTETIKKYRVFLARFTLPNGRQLGASTQAYHVIALRSFLRWLVKCDYPTLAPEKIDLPKSESRSLKFLTTRQVERLLGQPRLSSSHGLRDKAILEVLFSTGLQKSPEYGAFLVVCYEIWGNRNEQMFNDCFSVTRVCSSRRPVRSRSADRPDRGLSVLALSPSFLHALLREAET